MASLRSLAIPAARAWTATRTSPQPTATTPATPSGRSSYFKLYEYDFAGSLVMVSWRKPGMLMPHTGPHHPDRLAEGALRDLSDRSLKAITDMITIPA